jgi:hypothetical protein
MFYKAQNEGTIGTYFYIYRQREDTKSKKVIYFSYSINLDQNTLYVNDPWPEHLLNQKHIKQRGNEYKFLKLLFETNIEKVVEGNYD